MKLFKRVIKFVLRILFRRHLTIPIVNNLLGRNNFYAVDVGASHGLSSHWTKFLGAFKFIGIEPDKAESENLKKKYKNYDFKVLPIGLSEFGGMKTLNVTNVQTGSSLLEPVENILYASSDYFFPLKKMEVITKSLSMLIDEKEIKRIDIIKLDTQGTELEILRGLDSDRLSEIAGVEVEIGAPGFYRGQPTLVDFEKFLSSFNFKLFDLRVNRVYLKRNHQSGKDYLTGVFNVAEPSPTIGARVWEFDAVFLKDPLWILENSDEVKLRRTIVSYCVYNFFAEAYFLAEEAEKRNIINPSLAQLLKNEIKRLHKYKEYTPLYSKSYIAGLIRKILKIFNTKINSRWYGYTSQEYPS